MKWNILKESTNNKYIISYGPVLDDLKEALNDTEIGLINASTIKPLDFDLIKDLLGKRYRLYIYEEVINTGSMKMQMVDFANDLYQSGIIDSFKIKSKTLPDTYLEVGEKSELLDLYNMHIKDFVNFVKND